MVLVATILLPSALWAQEAFDLHGTSWVNSRETSLDRLKGKVVVLYFFSDECPNCKALVPQRNQFRKDFADKPVVFIAVNSLNPKSVVQDYAKSNKFEWPILVDETGETQKSLGFKISLQNIYQWRIIDPSGAMHPAPFEAKALTEMINSFVPQAKPLFAGITIPEKLKALARDIEFGLYEPAISDLAALAQKGPKDTLEAATAMYDRVKPLAESGLEKAKALETDGKKYLAYLEYGKVVAWFKKTDYEKTAAPALAALAKDKDVKDELAAKQMLDQAKALLVSTKKGDKESAGPILAVIQKKYPTTEAAKEAAKLAK
jgi:thiol-disulfide isomerase/thioredoxin